MLETIIGVAVIGSIGIALLSSTDNSIRYRHKQSKYSSSSEKTVDKYPKPGEDDLD